MPRVFIEAFVIILIISLTIILDGSSRLNPSTLSLVVTISIGAYRLLVPLQQCLNSYSGIAASQVSLHNLSLYLDLDSLDNLTTTHYDKPKVYNSPYLTFIELQDLSFRYPGGSSLILDNVNLSIMRGERIAFVGASGCGKTTLCDLLLGLLVPTKGTILVNNTDINESADSLSNWRKQVAYVPQHISFLDSTISANIAFGQHSDQIDYPRVCRAAKDANLAKLIESTPQGYDTFIGESGSRLSGGQRQRVGIARALYRQSKLLVLDEATSALDTVTESEIMSVMSNLPHDLTILLIAHRLRTVKMCHRIVFMKSPSTLIVGTWDELLSFCPEFKEMLQA